MTFERVHRSKSRSPQASSSTSQFAPRPFSIQEPKCLPTQEDIENEAFQQNKFEAFGLQLKEKHGTITPVEQERLGVLQAKMDSFWAQRMERAKAQPNLLEILIRNAQSTQATEQANESAAPVQPKLTMGHPNDQYEQEADRVAEQVMSMAPPATPDIQRQTEEEQEKVQTKPLVETITPIVQRQEALEEDEPIQAKCESCEAEEQVQRSPNGVPQVQADLENRLNASKGGGSPLPDEVRSFMEPRFKADFREVRVHTGSEAVQMNRDLSAQAFTHRQDIYFGAGKVPGKDALTAHELTHVVQQTYGQNNNVAQGKSKKPSSPSSKSIEVDLSSQNLYASDKGSNVYSFNCVSGDSSHPTPTGHFSVLSKHKTYTSKKYKVPMNYAMFFTTTGEAIHQSQLVGPSSYLKSWGLDDIGSHGCVRLAESDAATLFAWTPKETPVWVH